MDPTVKRNLSQGNSCGLTSEFSVMWTIICRVYDTQCVYKGQQNPILKNLFGMKTE
jgi:hypothetical protein